MPVNSPPPSAAAIRTARKPRASLVHSVRDGAAYGGMLGVGESYLAAYAIHLGAPASTIGILGTVAPYPGMLAQVLSANRLARHPRRRPLYLGGSILQLAMWPVLLATAWMAPPTAIGVLLAAVALYFIGVHFASPAWNSVMGDLVPFRLRGRFFARRNRNTLFFQVLGTVVGGVVLQLFAGGDRVIGGFMILFVAAFLARFVSVAHLARMADPPYAPRREDDFTLLDFLRALPRSNFAKFVLYVSFVSLGVNLGGPYVTPYMLRDLGFSYAAFMAANAAVLVAQVASLYTWGGLADRFGNKRILSFCGIGISIVPLLWLVARDLPSVVAVQLFGGAVWSGFNLSAANFLLDAVSPAKRARCVAYFNLLNGTGILLGGIAGVLLVDHLPRTLLGVSLFSPLHGIFALSFALRALTQVVFLPRFREVRDVPPISSLGLFFRATALKSISDLAMDLLTGQLRGGRDESREEPPRQSST